MGGEEPAVDEVTERSQRHADSARCSPHVRSAHFWRGPPKPTQASSRTIHMTSRMQRLSGDDGATMLEYALMVALIAVVCINTVSLSGNNSRAKFSTVGNSINSAS